MKRANSYRCERYLERALREALQQAPNLEFITSEAAHLFRLGIESQTDSITHQITDIRRGIKLGQRADLPLEDCLPKYRYSQS